ncbi:hypothetical protein [Legionella taurinensis]|uniref:Uncharacterized protein n=1 Tax=Legionella taurinensis TaxID=70611 RepID=A0A3A5L756_9GAMM|nr:hypothetical protein [Legionella taurinensis]RJT49117.1 hypothetical protein D6J04_00190 [Legionella taurinensis]RJT67377.1 hypothetical protein D6J03_07150 [Legionella taurinensis]STY26996.1 Uncharacterised protein [Legionella taurinensis]
MEAYLHSAQALKSTLQTQYHQLLASNHINDHERMKKLRAVQAGWILLAAVAELHYVYEGSEAEPHLTRILAAAEEVLLNPCLTTLSVLSQHLERLKQCMDSTRKSYTFFAQINSAADTVSATVSLMGISYGIAILLGFSGLALGPFGALALGMGVFFLSSLLASCAIESLSLNTRFCKNSQLQEINACFETLKTEFMPSQPASDSLSVAEAMDYPMPLQVQ